MKKNTENVKGLHYETYFNLIFDEMYIWSNIVLCEEKTGDILGYVYLKKVAEEITKLEATVSGKGFERQPAKTVMVFMLQGITDDTHELIGIYLCDALKASQLYSRRWDLISLCEESDQKIIALICDGISVNMKLFKVLFCCDELSSAVLVYVTKNFASGEGSDLFFLTDLPHLLKILRNRFANSNAHRRTRKLWKGGQEIKWEAIWTSYEVSLQT